jgi:hypothetical protein
MARTLKTAYDSIAHFVVAVDDDGTTLREYVTGNPLTINGTSAVSTTTWNGATVPCVNFAIGSGNTATFANEAARPQWTGHTEATAYIAAYTDMSGSFFGRFWNHYRDIGSGPAISDGEQLGRNGSSKAVVRDGTDAVTSTANMLTNGFLVGQHNTAPSGSSAMGVANNFSALWMNSPTDTTLTSAAAPVDRSVGYRSLTGTFSIDHVGGEHGGAIVNIGCKLILIAAFVNPSTAQVEALIGDPFAIFETAATGPTIDTHPSNATVTAPATANFTVAATTSGGTLTYQWQVDTGGGWGNVSTGTGGATNSYTTAATSTADNGDQYRCVVTDDNGSTNSNAATLTVNSAVTEGVRVQLYNGAVAQASLSGITALWWDTTSVNAIGSPDFVTSSATTDGSGWLQLDLSAATTLNVDDSGFLLLYKAGATPLDDLVFASRMVVEDIS